VSQNISHPPLVPLPLVREAAGFIAFSRLYYDASRGRLGPIHRLGTRKYVTYSGARAYLEKFWPSVDAATLDKLLQPTIVAPGAN
jgi:hypothetical protein